MDSKRFTDLLLSAGMLVLLSPVFLLVALAIWFETGSPILYRQFRVGMGFRSFEVLKFRTMRVREKGSPITVAGDPRITSLGKLLRVTKLDELPQLWNVLNGQMSLVGPRPELPEYVELFKERYATILTVRPGITDPSSIRFHDEESDLARSPEPLADYVRRVLPLKLDLAEEYLRRRSMWVDMSILLRTAIVLVRRR